MSKEANIILERVVLVKVEASIYGARKKLKKEDLVLADGSRLPPEDLASLGSKRLLDPDKLSVFNRLKKEAERICLRIGTRFLGGFAVPSDSATDITAELERIALDFAAAKADFLAGYDAAVTDWVVRHPEFAEIIERALDSVDYVSTRLAFDFLVLSIGLPEALPPAEVARLESKLGCLSGQMFYEISVEANQLIEQSLLGKDQVTRSALRPIRRMRDKLDGLGFLDYRVAPIVSTIDSLLGRIPDKGAIEGSVLQEILATAMLLADPDKTRRHGEGLLAAQSVTASEFVEDEDAEDSLVEPAEMLVMPTESQEPQSFPEDRPVLAIRQDAIQVQESFSDLFDGIFDDDAAWEAEGLPDGAADILSLQIGVVSQTPAISPFKPDEAEEDGLDVVTADEELAVTSGQDYWF